LTTQSYKMIIADSTARLIRGLHPQLKKKMKSGLRELTMDPFAGKELRDELKGLRSFRIGRFRIVYRISRKTVEIAAVGPRKTIYEETLRLIRKDRAAP
jgi:mRNA interferase RelE/StbE